MLGDGDGDVETGTVAKGDTPFCGSIVLEKLDDDALARDKFVRSLFEHITSGDILSAYAKATRPG